MQVATGASRHRAIALLSGGLDSSVLCYMLAGHGYDVHAITVDYNQRHGNREIDAACQVALALMARYPERDIRHSVVGLGPVAAKLLEGSALTSENIAVPHGHYTDESMRATVVPNRNAILLSLAYAAAVSRHAAVVAAAMHAGDHPIYPDCRPAFVLAFAAMEALATEGYTDPRVELQTPFIDLTKSRIVHIGRSFGVPFHLTWSCYEGNDVHCGQCGTCVERIEAFREAGVEDPTRYAVQAAAPS